MDLQLNRNDPRIMHIDLNSCFATVEQQANPLLRGKPIVVAAYNSPNGCVVSPSIEAKRCGIKTGMTVRDAKLLYPQVIVKTPDPPKSNSGCARRSANGSPVTSALAPTASWQNWQHPCINLTAWTLSPMRT